MPDPIDIPALRALAASCDGHTEGPWIQGKDSSSPYAGTFDHYDPFGPGPKAGSVACVVGEPEGGASEEEEASARLIAAAPDLRAAVLALCDEVERLRDGLDAIRIYGTDTLSGPANPADDTRNWQRDAVMEMATRAQNVLAGRHWRSGPLDVPANEGGDDAD